MSSHRVRRCLAVVLLALSSLGAGFLPARAATAYTLAEVPAVELTGYANARAVNEKGVVASDSYGSGATVATSVRKGVVTTLSHEPDFDSAVDISDKGRVVGSVGIPFERVRAMIWYPGQRDRATFARRRCGRGQGHQRRVHRRRPLHARGGHLRRQCQGLGRRCRHDRPGRISARLRGRIPRRHACSPLRDGEITDLGTLPGGNASVASGINDKGQIVSQAFGIHESGTGYFGYLLTPN